MELTPLMAAAKTNSEANVDYLLERKADPDVVVLVNNGEEDEDEENSDESSEEDDDNHKASVGHMEEYTALTYAIESGNIQIVTKLLKVTNKGLQVSFEKLAESAVNWSEDEEIFNKLKVLIQTKLEKDNHLYDAFLCLLYTSPSPRDATLSRMPSSA